MSFKSGIVAIIGRPNAGKSTFLNAVLGEKIAPVSEKPQTTRLRLRGVKNLEAAQIVFIDTPGVHKREGALNEFMLREAVAAMRDVDAVLFMVDSLKGLGSEEMLIVKKLKEIQPPVILALNKIDAVKKNELLELIKDVSELYDFKAVVPISALKNEGLDILLSEIRALLPEGPKYYPDDIFTDEMERAIAAEMIREKVFIYTREEIPYSVAVVVETFTERKDKDIVDIEAVINVERDSQKGIVIGKKGEMLKRIGKAAREDIERLVGGKVFLKLFVRVQKEWTKDKRALKNFGYD
jgi:GTP-binding protein Era